MSSPLPARPPDHLPCPICGARAPVQHVQCPDCGAHTGWPNVRIAVAQRPWLLNRAAEAREAAQRAGKAAALARLEVAAPATAAVWAAPTDVVRQLLHDERAEAAAYGGLLSAGARTPARLDDDRVRAMVEGWLFGTHAPGQVRYAALALDGAGLRSYGALSVTLRDESMVTASTVLSRNSWDLFAATPPLRPPEPGHAATWDDRAEVVIAKLAPELDAGTPAEALPGKLLYNGPSGRGDDEFVEVHRWGPFRRTAFAAILETAPPADPEEATLRDHARAHAARLGIPWTTR